MANQATREEILATLEPLFAQAKREGKWFNSTYQDLKFSPKELRERHSRGELIWSAVNWRLIDPPKPKDPEAAAAQVRKENAELERRIREG